MQASRLALPVVYKRYEPIYDIARIEDAHTATVSFYTMTQYTYNIGTNPGTYTLVIKTSRQEYEALLMIG